MSRELLIEFYVAAKPEPRGSKEAFPLYRAPRHLKRPVRREGKVTCAACGETDGGIIVNVTDDNPKSEAWQAEVRKAALASFRGAPAGECALEFEFVFYVYRPQDHWKGHLLRDTAPAVPIVRPDASKYERGTEDALTGIVWKDDAQVWRHTVEKRYAVPTADGPGEGVLIRVWRSAVQLAVELPMEERVRHVPASEPEEDPLQPSLL